MEVIGTTANDTWIGLLETIKTCGNVVQPRGFKCYEVMNLRTCFPMHKPIVTVRDRNLGYRFLFAEALWILEGKEDVATIAPFSKHIVQFSDDGETFFGAYGPRIVDQINWVVRKLAEDRDTRQAVLTIWQENPYDSKDIPCTISVQFLIRDGLLHCIDNMRSSDAWLGWPYDVFNFTMLSSAVIIALKDTYPDIRMGQLWMNLGSAHLYDRNMVGVDKCLANPKDYRFRYPLLQDPKAEWPTVEDLFHHLYCVSRNLHSELKSQWVCCVARGDHNKKGDANAEVE